MCYYPFLHKIFCLVYGTGGPNLHSQLLYTASSYILHANETINTPTHLSDASHCWGVKRCAMTHKESEYFLKQLCLRKYWDLFTLLHI